MHPAVARMCARAAAVTGLDVCGIDLRLTDISQPLVAGHAIWMRHRDQRVPGPADAPASQRGPAARRGRRHHRPPLPARRALPDADRVGDRDQRQDHHRPAHCAHPAPRRSARRDDLDRRRLHRRRPDPRVRRVRPEVGRHGSRRPRRAGRCAGDRTRRDRAPRPGLRPRRRRGGHQHHQRPPGHRRHRHHGRLGRGEVTGRRGDHLPRPARAQRRRLPLCGADSATRRPRPQPGGPLLQPLPGQPGGDRPPPPRGHRVPARGRVAGRGGGCSPHRSCARARRAAVLGRARRVHGRQRPGRAGRHPRARRAGRRHPGRPRLLRA